MTLELEEFTLTNSLTFSIFSGHEEIFSFFSCPEKMEIIEFDKVNFPSPGVISLKKKKKKKKKKN